MRIVILLIATVFSMIIMVEQARAVTSLNQLLDIAFKYNHHMVSASHSLEIDKNNTDIRNLFPPPHINVEWRGMPVNSFGNSTATMYTISQDIPFPTKIAAKWSILNTQAKMAEYDYNAERSKVIKEIKQAYYEYALNDKLLQLESDNYRFLEILYKSELKNYELGYSSQIDLIDVKTRLINSSAAAQQYMTNKYNAWTMLESLHSSPQPRVLMLEGTRGFMEDMPVLYYDQKDIDNIPHITKPMEELKNMAIANNPNYQKLSYEAQIAKAESEIAQSTYFPDIHVAFSQMDSSVPNMSERRFAVGFDLPWLWGGGINAGESNKNYFSKYSNYYVNIDAITSEIDGKSTSAYVLYRKLNEYKPILPIIEKQMNQVNLNYATRYDEPKALESAYNQFLKVNNAGKNYYEMYIKYIELALDVEELVGERLW